MHQLDPTPQNPNFEQQLGGRHCVPAAGPHAPFVEKGSAVGVAATAMAVVVEAADAVAVALDVPALRKHTPGGRGFSLVHAANLLCRLPEPRAFLRVLPSLLAPGGLVVFFSPYSWLAQYTPQDKWLGGAEGARSADVLAAEMKKLGFELVTQEDVPFLIREHARKFQYGVAHATAWRLKA